MYFIRSTEYKQKQFFYQKQKIMMSRGADEN